MNRTIERLRKGRGESKIKINTARQLGTAREEKFLTRKICWEDKMLLINRGNGITETFI